MSEPHAKFEALERRITAVEELLMHLDSKLEALDEVIRKQQAQLAALEVHARRWTLAWEEATEADGLPPRRLEDDKPPHY